jgi:hypothetical protein
MARITEPLYEEGDLNNPLPPLPPLLTVNEIEEGRFRDRLLAHQRKSVDAPRTLEVFNTTLSTCYRKLIAALPPIAKSTSAEFAKMDTVESFATLSLIDLMPNVGKTVMSMLRPFFNDEVEEIGLFASVRKQIDWNFKEASGVDDRPNSKYISADKYKGTPQQKQEQTIESQVAELKRQIAAAGHTLVHPRGQSDFVHRCFMQCLDNVEWDSINWHGVE